MSGALDGAFVLSSAAVHAHEAVSGADGLRRWRPPPGTLVVAFGLGELGVSMGRGATNLVVFPYAFPWDPAPAALTRRCP